MTRCIDLGEMDDRRRQNTNRLRGRDQHSCPSYCQHPFPLYCLPPLFHGQYIVDYYLGAILPSPESVRIDVSSIFLPTLTKLGLLPFLRHSHGKPFLFCDVLKTVPGLPQSGLLSQLRLVALLTQHGFSETTTPMLSATTPTPLLSPL